MEFSDLDAQRLAQGLPEGVRPGADTGSSATGTVLAVDAAARLVRVTSGGSDGVWVPAAPGCYDVGARVRLSRSPLDGGRIVAIEGLLDETPEIVTGKVTAINTGSGTLTVATLGGSFPLPFTAGTYAVNAIVHVLRSPQKLGAPMFVLGPTGAFAGADPGGSDGVGSNPQETVQRQRTIGPQWSGTYRAGYGWDRWNTDRFGGRSTLWQGSEPGLVSGLTGLAVYGDQIVNLGAVSILSIVVHLYRIDTSYAHLSRAPVVQPSPAGSQPPGAPPVTGATAAGAALFPGQATDIALPGSVLDGFRTGAYKGLATVGGAYGGFAGTSRGDGMLLTVQYTVKA